MSEDAEPVVTERTIHCYSKEERVIAGGDFSENASEVTAAPSEEASLNSFAWHPSEENILMAIKKNGMLSECIVPDRIAPSWSTQHCLVWPHGGILQCFGRDSGLCKVVEDISIVMQERAVERCYTGKQGLKKLTPLLDPSIISGKFMQ